MSEYFCVFIQFLLKFVPKGPIDKWVSVGSGNGMVPLSEPTQIQLSDMRHC